MVKVRKNFFYEAEIKINKIIEDSSEIKKLPESKKFLMISLILAEEGIRVSKINEEYREYFDNIDIELKKLENLIDAKK